MKKFFCCKDLGLLCEWESTAETVDELIGIVADHAAEKHGMREMTGPMREQILNAIRDSD